MATEVHGVIDVARDFQNEPIIGEEIDVTDEVLELDLHLIDPDPAQARDEGADDSIGDTLTPDAVLPPIEVRPHPDPARQAAGVPYQLIDGERRWRGSRKAGRATIRAIVNRRPMDPGDRLLRQTRLNAGKHLTPMEEARTWKRIMDAKGWSQQDLATALGKPKSTVGDRLAILEAPAPFQRFFLDGTLTAAAAPIVRQFADVPEKILERVAKDVTDDWEWDEAIREGRPVELKEVKRVLEEVILHEELRELYDAELRERYTEAGLETVTIKGKRYAVDVEAYDKMEQRVLAAREKTRADGQASAPAKREPDRYASAQRARVKAAKKKSADRRVQFMAVAAKLPSTFDGKWSLFLVKWLTHEMHQDALRNITSALGIASEKTKRGGFRDYNKAILAHAESLTLGERTRLVLQLLLAPNLYVGPYDGGRAERLHEAAALAKVNIAKIKAPDPDAEKKKAAKKAPAKKGEPKRARYHNSPPEFMKPQQPSAALAAIVGDKPIVRTEVTMKVWKYIKEHGLQDAKERRQINADDKLRPVFGGKSHVSMFEMTKMLNKHLSPVK